MCSHVLLEAASATFMDFEKSMRSLYTEDESWTMFGPMVEDVGYVSAEGRKEGRKNRILEKEEERKSFNSLDTLSIIGIRNLEVMSICIFKKTICEEF